MLLIPNTPFHYMFNQAYDNKKIHLNLIHFHRELILSSPILAFLYAKHVLHGGPFPEGEAIIATSSDIAYNYTRSILYAPFPLGEPAIAKDSYLAYLYAVKVLKGKFPLGEKVMAKNSDIAFGYTKYVLEHDFVLDGKLICEYTSNDKIKP